MYWFRRHNLLAPWSDERALSLMHLGRIAFAMRDYAEAAQWALQCTTTKSWPEPYWMLGMCYCEMAQRGLDVEHNFARAAHFLQRGFELDKVGGGASLLMKDPTARYDAHAYYAPVLAKLGRIDEAIESAKTGLDGKPELAHLQQNIRDWQKAKAIASVLQLEKVGVSRAQVMNAVMALSGGKAEPTRELPPPPNSAASFPFFVRH